MHGKYASLWEYQKDFCECPCSACKSILYGLYTLPAPVYHNPTDQPRLRTKLFKTGAIRRRSSFKEKWPSPTGASLPAFFQTPPEQRRGEVAPVLVLILVPLLLLLLVLLLLLTTSCSSTALRVVSPSKVSDTQIRNSKL